ncbi:MAG: hypothetical protein P9G45_02745 [Candidatus Contendobacter sp.]|nr:hypothetical protein [Candidatus Contendobacter sp.]
MDFSWDRVEMGEGIRRPWLDAEGQAEVYAESGGGGMAWAWPDAG